MLNVVFVYHLGRVVLVDNVCYGCDFWVMGVVLPHFRAFVSEILEMKGLF